MKKEEEEKELLNCVNELEISDILGHNGAGQLRAKIKYMFENQKMNPTKSKLLLDHINRLEEKNILHPINAKGLRIKVDDFIKKCR